MERPEIEDGEGTSPGLSTPSKNDPHPILTSLFDREKTMSHYRTIYIYLVAFFASILAASVCGILALSTVGRVKGVQLYTKRPDSVGSGNPQAIYTEGLGKGGALTLRVCNGTVPFECDSCAESSTRRRRRQTSLEDPALSCECGVTERWDLCPSVPGALDQCSELNSAGTTYVKSTGAYGILTILFGVSYFVLPCLASSVVKGTDPAGAEGMFLRFWSLFYALPTQLVLLVPISIGLHFSLKMDSAICGGSSLKDAGFEKNTFHLSLLVLPFSIAFIGLQFIFVVGGNLVIGCSEGQYVKKKTGPFWRKPDEVGSST